MAVVTLCRGQGREVFLGSVLILLSLLISSAPLNDYMLSYKDSHYDLRPYGTLLCNSKISASPKYRLALAAPSAGNSMVDGDVGAS